jgi:hypothetical protein
MTRFLFIFLLLSSVQIFGQKADTVKYIFGTNCPDSITDPRDRTKRYVLQWNDHEREITAYKSNKKKWSHKASDFFSLGDKDNYVNIKCIEFYEVNKELVIRLFLDSYITRNGKDIYHLDINQKNGKLVDKALAKK